MSVSSRAAQEAEPVTGHRLLHGLRANANDPSLDTHWTRWGTLPPLANFVVDELAESGLLGHGGAWFPVATKWRAVARSQRRPVVVANGAEGEPASRKDALLLTHAPHLVLDGLALAAEALRAQRAVAYVPASSSDAVTFAIAERRTRRVDPITIEVVESADRFIAGQESAVVNGLSKRRSPVPSFVGQTPIRERGAWGLPTLVQNVETLAHIALIARFGATWFRSVGTPEEPGTVLLTVSRPRPSIVEAVLGSSLRQATGTARADVAGLQGVLLGGYGGGWVSPGAFAELPVSENAARKAGATLGAGVVVLLPKDVCPLAEMADVVRYMQGQGAGQCGPCIHGLGELAETMERLAYSRRAPRIESIVSLCDLVDGRGACRHPDGVTRFVRSGLRVFADEVASHQHHGPCSRIRAFRVLPAAGREPTRRLVSRA